MRKLAFILTFSVVLSIICFTLVGICFIPIMYFGYAGVDIYLIVSTIVSVFFTAFGLDDNYNKWKDL